MYKLFKKNIVFLPLALLSFSLFACEAEEIIKEVVKEVPVEKIVTEEVIKEVIKEVPKEKIVEVIKEVPKEKIVEKTVEVVKEVPADPGKLVVYSGRKESLVAPIIAQFAEATGIDVQVKYGKTGEIAAVLMEEGSKSPADIFFAQDPGGLAVVVNKGMTEKIDAEILSKVPAWAQSANGQWVGISGRARAVVYNTESIDPATDLPETLLGFYDSEWKGRIGWPPTNGSFQAMITAMRAQWGEDKTREWLECIKANDPIVYPKNTPTVEAAGKGEIHVGFVNHYYLYRFLAEAGDGFGARNYYLNSKGPGSLVLVAGASILKTAENKDNAERFLNFMLSKVAQQYFTGQTYEYPLVDGVKVNRLLTPLADLNKADLDMADLEDLAGTQALLREVGLIN